MDMGMGEGGRALPVPARKCETSIRVLNGECKLCVLKHGEIRERGSTLQAASPPPPQQTKKATVCFVWETQAHIGKNCHQLSHWEHL